MGAETTNRIPPRALRLRVGLAVVIALVVAVRRGDPAGRPEGDAQRRPYTAEEFLGITRFAEVSVAPDGKPIAFITGTDDFARNVTDSAVWLIRGGKAPVRISRETGMFSALRWSPDSRWLAVKHTAAGREGASLEIWDGTKRKTGATFPRIDAFDWLRNDLVVAAAVPEETDKEFYGDVVRYAATQPRTQIHRVSINGKVLSSFAVPSRVDELRVSPDGARLAYVSAPPTTFGDTLGRWELFVCELTDCQPRQLTRNFVAESSITWSPDGQTLFFLGGGDPNADRNTETQTSLYRIDVASGAVVELAPRFEGSIEEFALGSGDPIYAAGAQSTGVHLLRIDRTSNTAERVSRHRGELTRVSASTDGSVVAYVLSTAEAFPELYVGVDPPSRRTSLNQWLSSMPRPEVETVRWPNGEGDVIEGVLYWPPGRRGETNLPFVVSIHGGPTWADFEVLSGTPTNYPALLASRGYLVLRPNYRGSIGRGDEFTSKISGYFCSRPVTDILTGVDFVVAQRWADPKRMGVIGYSYGGVLTDCVIVRTDRFRAAVSGAGVWNYISRFGTADNFITYDHLNRGQAPWEGFEQIWRESAISQAGNIKTPTLVVHGADDQRVHPSQSLELYRALIRLGVESELLIFPGEGHGFRKPRHKLTKVRAEIAWLDKHLLRP